MQLIQRDECFEITHQRFGYAGRSDMRLAAMDDTVADGDQPVLFEMIAREGQQLVEHGRERIRQALRPSQAGRFDPDRARFTTWLYRIVVNACIDHRRKRQLHFIPDHFDPVDPAIPIDQLIEHDEKQSALADALADLPATQRAAISLVYDEGLSGADTARLQPVST